MRDRLRVALGPQLNRVLSVQPAHARHAWSPLLSVSTHVLVLEVSEQLDLAKDALRVDEVIERLRDLLDRHLEKKNARTHTRTGRREGTEYE